MKKLIFTIVGAMLLGVAISNNPYGYGYANSALVVKTTDGSPISIKLDYDWFAPASVIRTGNIFSGNHRLKITRHQGFHHGHQTCNMHRVVVYNNIINVAPHSQVVVNLSHCNTVTIGTRPLPGSRNAGYSSGYGHSGYGGYGNNYGNGGYANNYGDSYNTGGGYGNNGGQFQQLKYTVQNASFDRDKLQIAKQYIGSNGITSQRVLELMNLLSFESNKLNLAKFAYEHTFDKQNYYTVNNGFSFSSSTRELNKHIAYY